MMPDCWQSQQTRVARAVIAAKLHVCPPRPLVAFSKFDNERTSNFRLRYDDERSKGSTLSTWRVSNFSFMHAPVLKIFF